MIRSLRDVLPQPENTPSSTIEALMQNEIEATEKQLREKKAALAKKKAKAVTETREMEEPDDLSSVSSDALVGGQASGVRSFIPSKLFRPGTREKHCTLEATNAPQDAINSAEENGAAVAVMKFMW